MHSEPIYRSVSFEPQKFFIGLVDFFSVILPGALLAYLTRDWLAETFLGRPVVLMDGAEGWAALLFAGYLLGHFAFLVGSTLDDLLYSPVRDATGAGQVRQLAKGDRLSAPWLRKLATSRWLFRSQPDAALMQAQRLRSAALSRIGSAQAVNAYQWSKARLSRDHPEGLVAVQRFEADSKFFRSFAVVLFILFFVLLAEQRWLAAFLAILLVVPALWRYADQRFKATQHAYWYLLMLEAEQARADAEAGRAPAPPPRRSDGLTHAGGVVFRARDRMVEYLLVESSAGNEWVLPKGHIEPFEDAREAAVREVNEEAGIWARILEEGEDLRLTVRGREQLIRFYLMEMEEEVEGARREGRRQRWLPVEEAVVVATHEQTRELLLRADAARRRGAGVNG